MSLIQKIKNYYHLIMAFLANVYFGYPSQSIKIIGVTGTDGKTTTTHLIYHILKSIGKKVSMISSIYADIGGKIYATGLHTTTPGSYMLQKLLRESKLAGDEYFVIETTSHAIDQQRIWGINFFISVLTNVTGEHIDYHGSYLNYIKTKAKLLDLSQHALVNKDDASFEYLLPLLSRKPLTYSLKNNADFRWKEGLKSNIPGEFNKQNIMAAYAVACVIGLKESDIASALKNFSLPKGRFDIIHSKDFKVIIDFAHTPNSIESLLKEIKKGRVIHVFGSAGQRDKYKRPLMGEMSGKYSDVVILTEEDYRNEDPIKITEEISIGLVKQGFSFVENRQIIKTDQKNIYTIINNRTDAIAKAIQIAKKGDVVVITGKGHEQSLARGNKELVWDEYREVNKALKKYDK